MSAALATAPLLPRLRDAGAEVVLREQRPVVQHVSLVPAGLLAEPRARRDDLIAELLAEANIEAAYLAAERAALITESEHGDPAAPVSHTLPPSWSDATVEPTAGARCFCCRGASWWCEASEPKGWRCGRCHPPVHLAPGQWRETRT